MNILCVSYTVLFVVTSNQTEVIFKVILIKNSENSLLVEKLKGKKQKQKQKNS